MNSENTVRRGFRPEIQGLRAVAVLLVIAYHLYPNRVPGGYVGVDVFFVLSGFLITSHLFREADSTSHLSLVRFWGRRIRRLLPASLLVLAVSLVLTWVWVPQSMWEQTLRQIGASALYVENWALAAEAVDYSAIGNEPTLVQHYWSLSVEEQFYLVWPLLVVAALLLVRRRGVALRPVLTGVFGAVVLASFVYSVVITSHDTARAYFVTPTRAWEFGVGALVGLLGASADPWLRTREPLRV
ncbi:acyltransferase family protein, partial [Nocardioides hankookensis]